jgi:hypothetical protein
MRQMGDMKSPGPQYICQALAGLGLGHIYTNDRRRHSANAGALISQKQIRKIAIVKIGLHDILSVIVKRPLQFHGFWAGRNPK